jgi:hypothetical protein
MILWAALAAAASALAFLTIPRFLLHRAQDRLAKEKLAAEESALLTRADLVLGRYRRAPGILGLTRTAVRFDGLFGESAVLPTVEIQRIETGQRLSSGRRLLRLEVLRLTRSTGEQVEFVLSPASAFAWRSHLGLWAVRERQADADRVAPGRGTR